MAINGSLGNQVFPLGRRGQAGPRRHAGISRQGGGWILKDLGNRNSTFVNGRRVTKTVALQAGDQVQIGNSLFQVTAGSGVEPSVEEPACPHCGQPVSRGARFCRHCGQTTP